MPISRTEEVYRLVKSLTKAEKRAFRLYATRVQGESDMLYLQLFDLLDRQKVLDEEKLRTKMPKLNASRYANLKRHLYKQILNSLRIIQKEKNANIKIREHIDFAYALYWKGLYMQALEILRKGKKLAQQHHTSFSLLTIIEFEKMIQSRHITRSGRDQVDQLLKESREASTTINHLIQLSNLQTELHRFYIARGHVKNSEEQLYVEQEFWPKLEAISAELLQWKEKVYYYQSMVWYHYIQNDFSGCLENAMHWVNILKESKELQNREILLLMRGYNAVLNASYNLRSADIFNTYLAELEDFRKSTYGRFNRNAQIKSFLFVHNGRMNKHFLAGTFAEGVEGIESTLRRISRYGKQVDDHKILVLYFKIAWMYIGNEQAEKAIPYLHHIINLQSYSLREDIQTYARLTFLMAHFDLENYEILPALVEQYDRYFQRVKEKNAVQDLVLGFFKEVASVPILERRVLYKQYHDALLEVRKDTFAERSFLYLDILPWLRAKIERKSLSRIMQEPATQPVSLRSRM